MPQDAATIRINAVEEKLSGLQRIDRRPTLLDQGDAFQDASMDRLGDRKGQSDDEGHCVAHTGNQGVHHLEGLDDLRRLDFAGGFRTVYRCAVDPTFACPL